MVKQIHKIFPKRAILLSLFLAAPLSAAMIPAQAAAASVPIRVQFISISGASLAALTSGHTGSGELLYFYKHQPRPSIAVILSKSAATGPATAQVYEAPAGLHTIPLKPYHGYEALPIKLAPALTMTSVQGWWVRHGLPNYNLNVSVYGPIYSMWGADPGFHLSYLKRVTRTELLTSIQVRTGKSGIPLWDYRQLIPSFAGTLYLRTHYDYLTLNYAQRESRPLAWKFLPSVSPSWPYVALSGTFLQQKPDQLNPPIVVNWSAGTISRFSEIVSVREQANGYDFYSLQPISPNPIVRNQPDFESPWGFYNLASTPQRYPNLIIRTQHFSIRDPSAIGNDPKLLASRPLLNYPQEDVRYSWAVHPGNVAFDYKVDVYGFNFYTTIEKLAGGTVKVFAPAYHAYPSWVIGQRWPVTTFVESQTRHYLTSEGIYQWPAQDVGMAYLMGWSSHPNLKPFHTILQGMRGEYRLAIDKRPMLYASPIDGRLHLLYAQGGLWNLGGQEALHESNLNHGPYINDWTLTRKVGGKTATVSQLAALGQYLAVSDHHHVIIKDAVYNPSLFTILPPTSKTTWSQFVKQTAPYREGKDPYDLASWLTGIKGAEVQGPGTIQSIIETSHVFAITVSQTHATFWKSLLPPSERHGLTPSSTIVLSYHSATHLWSLNAALAHPLSARLRVPSRLPVNLPHTLGIAITNTAPYSEQGSLSVSVNNHVVNQSIITLKPSEQLPERVRWTPTTSGTQNITVSFNHQTLDVQHLTVFPFSRPSSLLLLSESFPVPSAPILALILTVAIGGLTLVLWRRLA